MTLYPLHVLMTTDAVGGVWQYSVTLSRELANRGHRITLAVLGPPPDLAQRAQAEAVPGLSLRETGLPLDWLADGPAQVKHSTGELADLARRIGADLIHCNSPALCAGARFPVPVIAVAHGCIATWWKAARREPLAPELQWHAALMQEGLKAADMIVAPSASFARQVAQTYGLPRSPMVVHNGRNPLGSDASAGQLNVALTVGRLWDPVKNVAVLDQAAAQLDIGFLAAGALVGPHGETCAPENLQCLGYQSEAAIDRLLRLQPVFVSAATFEPFGLAVLEAASAGCALVLSNIDTFRELWEGAALFVDSGDAEGFARQINALIADPSRRKDLGEAARKRSANYSPAATVEAMCGIYQSLLAAREVAA
ncbi:MAG: glycosyltransferase family 4 protein [Erythrobacter sp.]|nr:MAG: glycosyltransferase family 4 protein [Erythrobacter sp.]